MHSIKNIITFIVNLNSINMSINAKALYSLDNSEYYYKVLTKILNY